MRGEEEWTDGIKHLIVKDYLITILLTKFQKEASLIIASE